MKDTKPKLSKIVLEIGGKRLEFTADEAKELKIILSDLFGGEKITYVDRWHYSPPYRPWWQTYGATDLLYKAQTVGANYVGQAWSGSINDSVATLTAKV